MRSLSLALVLTSCVGMIALQYNHVDIAVGAIVIGTIALIVGVIVIVKKQ